MQAPMRKRWRIALENSGDGLTEWGDMPPVMRRLLSNRLIHENGAIQQYLFATGPIHDPFLMLDMDAVVDRLQYAVEQREPLAVYGDYDVDGVTATALLVQYLQRLGADARGYIPNRFEEGYGLNTEALDHLHADGVRLVVTVDCGIRSPIEAEYGRSLGLDLIISDHHEPHHDLPQAVGVICPKRPGDAYPEKNLAGVGLAFKICQALSSRFSAAEADPDDFLDLVAVGTVADIVPLVGENRTLVKAGLKRLRSCQRQGLLSLAGAAELALPQASARDIGFVLGPRLNAAGRLESALAAFELLMCSDVQSAGMLAQKLDNQNRQRQEMTIKAQEKAEALARASQLDSVLFAFDPDFNMGIVGLVASRLTDLYYRPAIVGYQGDEFTRASCRSIPEFHITRALDECADLLVRHGGHALAAGFTVRNENVPELVRRMSLIGQRELEDKELCPVLNADMEITFKELHPDILNYIEMLEPTGLGNPGVLFVSRSLKPMHYKTVGRDNNHLKMALTDGWLTFDAIAFRQGHWNGQMPEKIDILFSFEKNIYQGRVSLQLNIKDMKPAGTLD